MKRKLVFVSILGKLLVLLVSACLGTRGAEDPLTGTAWELRFYRKSSVIAGTSITAKFMGGQVRGSAGCNDYIGEYQAEGDQIIISEVASNTAECFEPAGILDQESLFLEYMYTVRTIKFVDDQLQLVRPDGETLTFVPAPK